MQASRRRDGSAGRACPQCCISAGRCCNPAVLACPCIPSLCMRRGSTLTLPKINYASPSPPVAAAGTSQGALAAQQPVLQPHPQPCAAGGGRRGSVPIVSGPVAYLRGSAACLGTTGGQCRRPLRLPLAWKICGFNPVPTTSSPRWQSHAARACPPAAVRGHAALHFHLRQWVGPGFRCCLLDRTLPPACPCPCSFRDHCADCHPEEHYVPTLLASLGREDETDCSSWGVVALEWSGGKAHEYRHAGWCCAGAAVVRLP